MVSVATAHAITFEAPYILHSSIPTTAIRLALSYGLPQTFNKHERIRSFFSCYCWASSACHLTEAVALPIPLQHASLEDDGGLRVFASGDYWTNDLPGAGFGHTVDG